MAGDTTPGWARSRIIAEKMCSTQVDVTSSTALVTVTGCTHKLQSGGKYMFEAFITGTAGASGGAKVAIAGSGGLTATQFSCTARNYNGATLNANTTTTTLGTAVGGATAAMTDINVYGTITVGVGGVLTLQIAQNASNGTATSAYVGSYMTVVPVH